MEVRATGREGSQTDPAGPSIRGAVVNHAHLRPRLAAPALLGAVLLAALLLPVSDHAGLSTLKIY
jgi:hypothetical protein